MRNLILAACPLLLSGCMAVPTYQSYEGSALPPEQVAFIKTESERNNPLLIGLDKRLYIAGVDGVRPPIKPTTDVPFPESATVLPGPHRIGVVWEYFGKWTSATIDGHFEAGKRYIIRQQPGKKSVRFWIEELPPEAAVAPTADAAGRP